MAFVLSHMVCLLFLLESLVGHVSFVLGSFWISSIWISSILFLKETVQDKQFYIRVTQSEISLGDPAKPGCPVIDTFNHVN